VPGKAARLHLESDSDLHFEFFLAHKLGMTRARLLSEVTNIEFLYWSRYFDMINQERELANARLSGG
jgi:hypothetical protein